MNLGLRVFMHRYVSGAARSNARLVALALAFALACALVFPIIPSVVEAAEARSRAADDGRVVLRIAAAADLKFALDELLEKYASIEPDTRIDVTYGSSGNFFAQLSNGAPFDLYLSADVRYPRLLADAGLALDDDVFLYAVGRIVVWVPAGSPVDLEGRGIEALRDPSLRKIAIANPRHAPYGVAAMEAIRSYALVEVVEPRLVLGENVAQTAQFVQSGAASIGIIARSLASAPTMRHAGRSWLIPRAAHARMDQGGLIARSTRSPLRARRLRDFLVGEVAQQVLERYGFERPGVGGS